MIQKLLAPSVPKLNPKWIKQTPTDFLEFLRVTRFPELRRNGTRGSTFEYPEWLIMLIAVLSVKCKVQTYQGIHRLTVQYWDWLTPPPGLAPISESQLRDRLKKSGTRLESLQASFFKSMLQQTWKDETVPTLATVSADKMMVKARGPVWHTNQKAQNLIPNGLHGLDRAATWGFSRCEGWIYGHGTFCLTTHRPNVLGAFKWMQNSAHEAKRLEQDIGQFERLVKWVCMDSKADDYQLSRTLKDNYDIQLLTTMRRNKLKSLERQQLFQELQIERHQRLYMERSHTVEPMQSLVKNIFDLDHCWMRGNDSNRWLFAAMGVAVQIAQRQAYHQCESTWEIKDKVLGL